MTWSEFKADVKTLLTVDANRLGTTSFTDRYIIGGTEAVLSHVPFYRSTNSTRYNNTAPAGIKPLTTEGNASAGSLPNQANVIQAWVITDVDADASVTDSSDTECIRYPLIPYSYSNKNDLKGWRLLCLPVSGGRRDSRAYMGGGEGRPQRHRQGQL